MQKEPEQKAEQEEPTIRQVKLTLNREGAIQSESEKPVISGDLPDSPANTANANDLVIERVASNRSHSTEESKKTNKTPSSATKSTKDKTRGRLSNLGLSGGGQLTLKDQKKLGARIYHLKSYTTVGKINRKFAQDKQQRWLRNVLAFVMLIVILIILFVVYNPVRDIIDFRKMLGLDSPFKTISTELETVPPNTTVSP